VTLDFNDAGEQRTFDVIPANTIATAQMRIRPGQAGEGGWLRRSKAGNSEALDIEFTVCDGPYAKRKFWELLTVNGTTEGHKTAREINFVRLRAILESARGIKPDDHREAAKNARQTNGWEDFNGIRFIAKIGVEPAKTVDGKEYPARNILLEVITPNRQEWRQPDGPPLPEDEPATQQAATVTPIVRPAWAK
jgi:hypothetical protein